MELPPVSSVSMRAPSPNSSKAVLASPCSMISIMRLAARHEQPTERSRLDTVPESMMAPARPNGAPLTGTMRRRCSLPPSHAMPEAGLIPAPRPHSIDAGATSPRRSLNRRDARGLDRAG